MHLKQPVLVLYSTDRTRCAGAEEVSLSVVAHKKTIRGSYRAGKKRTKYLGHWLKERSRKMSRSQSSEPAVTDCEAGTSSLRLALSSKFANERLTATVTITSMHGTCSAPLCRAPWARAQSRLSR